MERDGERCPTCHAIVINRLRHVPQSFTERVVVPMIVLVGGGIILWWVNHIKRNFGG